MDINIDLVKEYLRLNPDKTLYHRESQNLEFKEQFNLAGLAEYFKDFSALANNSGGYIIFGVSNVPRKLIGLSKKSKEQFEKIDPEKISGFLIKIFSPNIEWFQATFEIDKKTFGIFFIQEAKIKPIIAKSDEGKDQIIKNGDVYYRYGGRSQTIQCSELESIIQKRISMQNTYWMNLFSKISKIGPSNAAILDTERGLIEKDEKQLLVIDEDLASKIKFLKEGEFQEEKGATALKLVGDIYPIEEVEVTKIKKQNLLELYPLTYKQAVVKIKQKLSSVKEGEIIQAMKINGIKNNKDYSAYNFRNRTQEQEFLKTGNIPKGIPSIYNENAVGFLVKLLKR